MILLFVCGIFINIAFGEYCYSFLERTVSPCCPFGIEMAKCACFFDYNFSTSVYQKYYYLDDDYRISFPIGSYIDCYNTKNMNATVLYAEIFLYAPSNTTVL